MKKVIATAAAPGAIGPYSQAIEANGFVFASGQIPLDPATGAFVPGGVAEQAEQALKNLAAVLAWCVVGCMAWMQDGGLGEPPDRFKRQAARFYEDSDTLQQFIDEECTTGGRGSVARVRVKEFCDRYRDWLREPIKRKTITALMKRKGYIPHRYGDWGQCFDGLEMNNRDIFSIT